MLRSAVQPRLVVPCLKLGTALGGLVPRCPMPYTTPDARDSRADHAHVPGAYWYGSLPARRSAVAPRVPRDWRGGVDARPRASGAPSGSVLLFYRALSTLALVRMVPQKQGR